MTKQLYAYPDLLPIFTLLCPSILHCYNINFTQCHLDPCIEVLTSSHLNQAPKSYKYLPLTSSFCYASEARSRWCCLWLQSINKLGFASSTGNSGGLLRGSPVSSVAAGRQDAVSAFASCCLLVSWYLWTWRKQLPGTQQLLLLLAVPSLWLLQAVFGDSHFLSYFWLILNPHFQLILFIEVAH